MIVRLFVALSVALAFACSGSTADFCEGCLAGSVADGSECADCAGSEGDAPAACCEVPLDGPGPDTTHELAALAPESDDASETDRLAALLGGGAEAPPAVDDGTDLPNHGPLPDFALISDTGDDFTREDLLGEVWVVDFIFTRCAGPCPQMSRTFADLARDELPARLLSVTVDPGYDSPQVLDTYRTNWDVEADRWTLLTGSHAGIRDLAENGFRLPVNTSAEETVEGMGPLFHSGKFALVDAEGRVRGYYDYRDALELERLQRDAAALTALAH